jgi:hypothetical protein
LAFDFVVRQHDAEVQLYISRGRREENKATFDALHGSKDQVEASFGEPLDWLAPEERETGLIRKKVVVGGYRDGEDEWPAIQAAMIAAMLKLESALRPFVARLPI